MPGNFKGRLSKDTESASETIISSSSFINPSDSRMNPKTALSITNQQRGEDNFETFIEKIK